MIRLVPALFLLLIACADDPEPSVAEPTPPASVEAVEMSHEDSVAAIHAAIDSLRQAIAGTQAEVDAGFRETDSMRQAIDALGSDIEATRERIEETEL